MNNNQKALITMGLMVALAFVVVGASSLVTPVTEARPSVIPGDPKSDCAQGPGVCVGARGPDPILPPGVP
jgi:hypothetical protein